MKADVKSVMVSLTEELATLNARREVIVGALKGLIALNGNATAEPAHKTAKPATKKRSRRKLPKVSLDARPIIAQRMQAATGRGEKTQIAHAAAQEFGGTPKFIAQQWKTWLPPQPVDQPEVVAVPA